MNSPISILLLEDEGDLLSLYEFMLGEDYQVRACESGQQALKVVDEDVDVGLLDRKLPKENGDEILRELRDRGYDFPVAMISAVYPETDLVDLPCEAYLHKPIGRAELVETVEHLQQLHEVSDRAREAFAAARKKAVLDDAITELERQTTEYERLVSRFEQLREVGATELPDWEWVNRPPDR